jgi:5-methylcytosine-specific restriction endonuclease McrA
MKTCSKCNTSFPLTIEYFHRNSRSKDGFLGLCKTCALNHKKLFYQQNVARLREQGRLNYAKNFETVRQYREKNKAATKEYHHQHYLNNKSRIVARNKQYAIDHREEIAQYVREWYLANRDNIIQKRNHYIAKRQEHNLAEQRKYYVNKSQRRRSKKNSLPATLTQEQWEQIVDHFDHKCAYCGAESMLTRDHLIALANGGGYTKTNIIPACKKCNSSKRTHTFESWYRRQDFYSAERERMILQIGEAI